MWKISIFKKDFTYIIIVLLICSGFVLIPTQTQATITNIGYDFIIITPADFSNELQPLLAHKEQHKIVTKIVTLDDIYNSVYFPLQGRDDPEKIKYFIKNAYDTWEIKYVLLLGSVDLVPIRECCISLKPLISEVPSDLYYADIYDKNGSFCSWDSNDNGDYGEYFKCVDPDNDKLDLYPDVFLGRLPCKSESEVNIVIRKIIDYETFTYGEEWFNNIILIGGDTHVSNDPGYEGCEGEYENLLVEYIMSDFIPTRLWASKGNLNPHTINQVLRKGAGFVHYSGHGGLFAIGTHLPGNKDAWTGYLKPNLFTLFNKDKLPVIFFSACETAMVDANLSDWGNRFGIKLPGIPVSCFAWNWIKKPNGGAIACIGATRSSSTHPQSLQGHGFFALQFFEAYNRIDTLGQMFAQGQRDFIDNASWTHSQPPFDWCHLNQIVVEEFVLLGDPSLKIGGY
jgi:hypothetical protein